MRNVCITGLCAAALLGWAPGAGADDAAVFNVPEPRYPAYVLEIPESYGAVFIADTSGAALRRFARSGEGVVEVDQRYMSIGLNGVGKERAWDRRTPLGIYFVTERLDTSKLADKYGVAAFPLDYPNAWDRLNERTGDGIWLHGVDHRNPGRPPRDTDGCLALPNDALLTIADELEALVTPVIVVRDIEWASAEQLDRARQSFRQALDTWRDAVRRGDLLSYRALYAPDFRHHGMERDDWLAYRMSVFEARPLRDVLIDDVLLLADPEVPDLYLSRFSQTLTTADGAVTTTKRLYWQRDAAAGWQIVAEDAG